MNSKEFQLLSGRGSWNARKCLVLFFCFNLRPPALLRFGVYFVFSCERAHSRPLLSSLLSAGNSGSGAPVPDEHTGAAHTQRAASAGLLQLHVRPPPHTHTQACFTVCRLNNESLSPPFLLSDFVSLERFAASMKLRKECGEAMHSIAMVTIRLQSCLSLEHRIRML